MTAARLLDVRGLACPEPVIRTRKAMLDDPAAALYVVVNEEASVENIERLARTSGWNVAKRLEGPDTHLVLTPGAVVLVEQPAVQAAQAGVLGAPQIVVLLASDRIGTGDDRLGAVLMRAFIKTLKEINPLPKRILFMNAGVLLTTTGSELLDDFRLLELQGLELLSCGTCLDFFGRLDQLQVGRKSNMFEIAESLLNADRVVRP